MEVVVPNAHNAPSGALQRPRDRSVSLPVPGDLGIPVFAVGRRPPIAARTAVPETAVHEQRDTLARPDEILAASWHGGIP